jgi:putative intracellular protease/amidase
MDGNLVTGENPDAARRFGEALVERIAVSAVASPRGS